MKSKWFISGLAVFVVATCGATLVRHLHIVKDEIENTVKSRNELMGKFVRLQRNRVLVLANRLLNEYQHLQPGVPLVVQQHPEGFWQLAPTTPIAGTLTGMGPSALSPAVEREIYAALSLDVQIKPILKQDSDTVWEYFLSANQFIYLTPATPVTNFHFRPSLYQRQHWLDAGPVANKERRLIITEPYEDVASKDWIITFAQPVYADDQFLGIVALDLNVDTLEQLTTIGSAVGESMLLSEHGQVIARQSGFQPGLIMRPPLTNKLIDWREDEANDLWLSGPVVEDELWLVHRLTRGELYWAVARESLGVWTMVIMFSLLMLISLRLRKTLVVVTRLTRVDSLTKALNRRGFYEEAERAIAIAQRRKSVLAVLILDIDYFKKINDNYGHAEGDSVLKQLGSHINSARRPYDIFCRWGGEEFLLLLSLDRAEDALPVAERMRSEAQRTTIHADNSFITLSGGLVLMGADELIDDAVKRADELLYHAKQAGRNRIIYE